MSKIMLVLDNKDDQGFLEKVLARMEYTVISMKKGSDLSTQLIDHFPDVVFASTLGRNEKILNALGKIKEVRGKPKLVFVKQEKETSALSTEQKKIIDGVLYSPVDPFKLIDVLATTTEVGIIELRRRYNEMLTSDRDETNLEGSTGLKESKDAVDFTSITGKAGQEDYGATQVIGKKRNNTETEVDLGPQKKEKVEIETYEKPEFEAKKRSGGGSSLIHDEARKKKYDELAQKFNASNPNEPQKTIDVQKLREMQSRQSEEIQEPATVKENRKHFLKTLFSMNPEDVKKDS